MVMRCREKIFAITVPLDAATAERLARLSAVCDDAPEVLAASLLRDILEDDAEAHGEMMAVH